MATMLPTPAKKPRNDEVSIIILTRNSAGTLRKCLKTVIREKPGEILAVDAQSTDETTEILKENAVRILVDPYRSLGYSRQLGLLSATSRYVMFVDSDVELTDNCLTLLISDLENNDWVGVHAKLLSAGNSSYWENCQNEIYMRYYGIPGPRDRIDTICAMFRRDILLKVGFDPHFKESAEDIDLCRRLRANHLGLGASAAVAYHQHRLSFVDFARQRFRNGIGVARLSSKYGRRTILNPLIAAASQTIRSLNPRQWKMILFWVANGTIEFIGTLYGVGRIARSSLSINAKDARSEK